MKRRGSPGRHSRSCLGSGSAGYQQAPEQHLWAGEINREATISNSLVSMFHRALARSGEDRRRPRSPTVAGGRACRGGNERGIMTSKTKPVGHKKPSHRKELAAAKLDELIEEATVDAYREPEQTTGFYTVLEKHLAMPFKTKVLGVEVTVERIDVTDDEQIVAVCARQVATADPDHGPTPAGPASQWFGVDRRLS